MGLKASIQNTEYEEELKRKMKSLGLEIVIDDEKEEDKTEE